MTLREKINMVDRKLRMMKSCNWECEVCGKQLNIDGCQVAHRIPQTKCNLKKYGKAIIHHPLNLACVCSLKCNSAVLLNPATHPVEAKELIEKIKGEVE